MSSVLLLLLLAVIGVFVYLMCFKNMIVYPLLIPVLAIAAIWYVVTFLVTKGMVKKQRGNESFLFIRARLIDDRSNNIVYGALVATKDEVVFYQRKNSGGGIKVCWSAFVPTIESYSLEKVDGAHNGIKLSIKGETRPILIASGQIAKNEKAFRDIIGWD